MMGQSVNKSINQSIRYVERGVSPALDQLDRRRAQQSARQQADLLHDVGEAHRKLLAQEDKGCAFAGVDRAWRIVTRGKGNDLKSYRTWPEREERDIMSMGWIYLVFRALFTWISPPLLKKTEWIIGIIWIITAELLDGCILASGGNRPVIYLAVERICFSIISPTKPSTVAT